MTLSEYVQRIMDEKGLKKIDIQRRSGDKIADSHISNILDGITKNLTIEKINALAEGLGVDPTELFKIASGLPVKLVKTDPWPVNVLLKVVEKIVSSPDLTRIAKALPGLKPAKIKAILKIIDSGGDS